MNEVLIPKIKKPIPEEFGLTELDISNYITDKENVIIHNNEILEKHNNILTIILVGSFLGFAIAYYELMKLIKILLIEFVGIILGELFHWIISIILAILFYKIAIFFVGIIKSTIDEIILRRKGFSYKSNEIIELYLELQRKWQNQDFKERFIKK